MSDQTIPPVTPHLTVSNASAAIDFYRAAFDAQEVVRMAAEDGKRLIHASLRLNGSLVMLVDDFPEHNAGQPRSPTAERPSCVTIHLQVTDVDAAVARAAAAGATVTFPAAAMFLGQRDAR